MNMLHSSILYDNNLEVIKQIDICNNINILTPNQSSALHLAVDRGDLFIINKIIELGINGDYQNDIGDTALMWAIDNNDLEICKILIKSGVNVNLQDNCGLTALHRAIIQNNLLIIHLLLKSNADISIKDNLGLLPQDYNNNNYDIVNLILNHQINFND